MQTILIAPASPATSSFSAHAQIVFDDGENEDCLQLAPAALGTGSETELLNVAVLLDDVSEADGRRVMERARAAYTPINVDLRSSFQEISVSSNQANDLMNAAKNHFGGSRPAGTDVVYLLTSKDIDDGSLAGLADCIGGVRYPDRAFAIGEYSDDSNGSSIFGLELGADSTAKIAAHEIGHLLGAHHHQSNCTESATFEANGGCTLMINDIGLASLGFSTVNGTVSRGVVQAFANDNRRSDNFAQGSTNSGGSPATGSSSGGGGGSLPLSSLILLASAAFVRRRRTI